MEKDRDIEEKERWELGLKGARHRDTEGEKERNAEAGRRQRGGGVREEERGRGERHRDRQTDIEHSQSKY